MSKTPRLYACGFATADALSAAIAELRNSIRECELLPISTCQRHEVFILSNESFQPPASAVRTFESADAALRLFEITAGVLSDVPGEEAVALQVKRAIREALRSGAAASTMAKLVRRALRAGDSLRERVRRSTPIIELPELLTEFVEGRIILLGAGALGRSIYAALTACGLAPAVWATRAPRSDAHVTIARAIMSLRPGDTLISALAGVQRPIEMDRDEVRVIDLGEPRSVRPRHRKAWALTDVIARSRDRLASQSEAVKRAAHRLPALAEAALAECICPSIKALNRAINTFRTNIVEAELARLAPMLANLDRSQAEIVRRSIQHAAARSAHPLHEYVNALGRQGRADEAQLLIDHILGSRIGIQPASIRSPRARKGQA